MNSESHQISTPLGKFEFSVSYTQDTQNRLANLIRVRPFTPSIPDGMSVAGCFSAVLNLYADSAIKNLCFAAHLRGSEPIAFDPETGEGLEALSFSNSKYVLLVGSEDREFLSMRLPNSIVLPNDPFTYTAESLSIEIAEIPVKTNLSLHFIIAWNSLPEPQDCSCWFAVDQPHKVLSDS